MERAYLWAPHWKGRGEWIVQFDTVVGLVVGSVGRLSLGASATRESQDTSLRESQERAKDNCLEKYHLDH